MKRDYYEVLSISRTAEEVEIKRAYRRLAQKHHPDRNPGDKAAEEAFKECKEAYEVLSDARKRALYDQHGHAGLQGGPGGPHPGQGPGGFADIFGDVFADIFGGGGRRQGGPYRGADLRYQMEISLEEAVAGTTSQIRIPSLVACGVCSGSGVKKGSKPSTCPTCEGQGRVRIQQGFFSIQQTCPRCKGRGQIITDPCDACHGHGKVQQHKTLSVKIPPGVDNGDRIRLAGEGEAGEQGGPPGDLYVELAVREHPVFHRDGPNLYTDAPISFVTAALGGEIEIPTLDGHATIKVPAETQSGKQFRLRGKGVKPVRGGGPGDLICRVVVETPVNLNKRQKELLREFEASLGENAQSHSPQGHSWLDSVKSFVESLKDKVS